MGADTNTCAVRDHVAGMIDRVITDIAAQSWAVAPGFLAAEDCRGLVADIAALQSAGQLRAAGVGRGDALQVRPEIRGDLIHWLSSDAAMTPPQQVAWQHLSTLCVAMNRQLYLGLRGFEGHLTAYPPGAGYAKHVDNFRDRSHRIVSCVLYLNEHWTPGDGGELRIFGRSNDAEVAAVVAPTMGTLACFMSAEIAHEVLQAKKSRYSLTGWFLDGE